MPASARDLARLIRRSPADRPWRAVLARFDLLCALPGSLAELEALALARYQELLKEARRARRLRWQEWTTVTWQSHRHGKLYRWIRGGASLAPDVVQAPPGSEWPHEGRPGHIQHIMEDAWQALWARPLLPSSRGCLARPASCSPAHG